MLSQSVRLARPRASARTVRVSATKTVSPTETKMVPMNVSVNLLKDTYGGSATRNIDGTVYTIRWDADAEKVVVTDRLGAEYPTTIGAKDFIIRADLTAGAGGGSQIPDLTVEQLKAVTGFCAPAELINGRAACLGFVLGAYGEIAGNQTLWQQIFSPSFFSMVFISAAVTAASVAPLATGAVKMDKLFPDLDDKYTDRAMPTFWTPQAEDLNCKAASVGVAGMLLIELFRGVPTL
mmetsp:Transcript_29336/g.95595  ORF Transcript_29336/g.95595 Transcript_29336/m.95595 type:complete len:236 (+) Transcript_29336:3-710(+)